MGDSTGDAAGVLGVGQVAVPVQDVERSLEFYRGVLGLPFLFRAGGLAFLDGGGVRIMLSEPEGDEPVHGPLLYYRCADLAASDRRLRSAGVEVVAPPHLVHRDERMELHIGFYRDPDGHLLGLMHEAALGA
jgi:catechol 2,3-dioxygenase-like lactoylglutathione lyase family enzyme